MPIETAEQKLKDTTYPYCKNLTNNYDFIGSVFNDKVDITINTTVAREFFKTTVDGYFYENQHSAIFQATLNTSSITKRFVGFINVILLIILVCFHIFAISKFFVPLALIILINLFLCSLSELILVLQTKLYAEYLMEGNDNIYSDLLIIKIAMLFIVLLKSGKQNNIGEN